MPNVKHKNICDHVVNTFLIKKKNKIFLIALSPSCQQRTGKNQYNMRV